MCSCPKKPTVCSACGHTHTHFLRHPPHPTLPSSCMSAFPWSAELMLCLPGYPQNTHKRGVRARLMRFFPWSSAKKSSSSNQSKWSLTLCRPLCFCVHLVWLVCFLSKTVILFAAFVFICSGDLTVKHSFTCATQFGTWTKCIFFHSLMWWKNMTEVFFAKKREHKDNFH